MNRSVTIAALALVAGCGPKHRFTDADVPRLSDLGDVMWAQAQVADPAFKKIGAARYSDEEFAGFVAVGGRLKLTTARIKSSFSKGPEFDAFADRLAARGDDLVAASTAKDAARASAALQAAKDTCKSCHRKFR